jgi:hypothetical protein
VANMLAHFAVTANVLIEIFVFDENVDMYGKNDTQTVSIYNIDSPYSILSRQPLFAYVINTKRRALVKQQGTKINFYLSQS